MANPKYLEIPNRKNYHDWTIDDLIDDSGGNGVVWRTSNSVGNRGALKVLRRFDTTAKAERRRERFINEISKLEMIMKLGISGVMPILDYDAKDEPPWFVMPLAHNLEPTGDRVEWALETIIAVSQCVADLHQVGMVHRDLKPNNLLVLEGKVVVSDFGLARIADDAALTKTGEAVGSFGYTGPECVSHSDEPLFKCDVYALAKTSWMLLTGANIPPQGELRHPDDSLTIRGVVSSSISVDRLDELLIASTVRDPDDRPTARQFLDGLRASRFSSHNPGTRRVGSPADRAKSLFADQAAKNRRVQQAINLYQSLMYEARDRFFAAWVGVVKSLGWSSYTHSGGSLGNHTKQLADNWEGLQRYFIKGEIDGVEYEIAVTFRRRRPTGEARLVLGATIAIQVTTDEYVIASFGRETYTFGPKTDQVRRDLLAFVESEETQYRTIEKLKELTEQI